MSDYVNDLGSPAALQGWIAEGPIRIDQGPSGVILSSEAGPGPDTDDGHWTLWCPDGFTDDIRITWEFRPISEPGLAMLFFAATGHSPGGLFSPSQADRDGGYGQYHSGDIDALHVSYFRHKWPDERAFRTCNLRKSAGFHLVAQGADPLPPAGDATGFYRMAVEKRGPLVRFFVNELLLFAWHDDGTQGGPPRGGGHIGFRQMAPLVAEYRALAVTDLHPPGPVPLTDTSPHAPGDSHD
jgi:hypothetical protein